jgi:hypothetical protein
MTPFLRIHGPTNATFGKPRVPGGTALLCSYLAIMTSPQCVTPIVNMFLLPSIPIVPSPGGLPSRLSLSVVTDASNH